MDFVSRKYSFLEDGPCIIIGEVGVNHNNREDILFRLIDFGIASGVDIIKFQKFDSQEEISTFAPKAHYQVQTTGSKKSQLEMVRELEMSEVLLLKAFEYCKNRKVGFLCAAFDFGSIDFVSTQLKCETCKIPSSEVTNKPLLEYFSRSFKYVILSTGASSLREVLQAIEWMKLVNSSLDIVLMHCVSEYPAPRSEANLRAIQTLRLATSLPVGYSDHTEGINAAIVAASLGASIIEKHYTIDKNLPGPDHRASADICEMTALVKGVKEVHAMLGSGIKSPCPSEEKNINIIRKSLVYSADFSSGYRITQSSFKIKRPFIPGSVSPEDSDKIINFSIRKNVCFDEPIMWEDFK